MFSVRREWIRPGKNSAPEKRGGAGGPKKGMYAEKADGVFPRRSSETPVLTGSVYEYAVSSVQIIQDKYIILL